MTDVETNRRRIHDITENMKSAMLEKRKSMCGVEKHAALGPSAGYYSN
jgi:hypothetical protein